ncbi:hypothetical protein BKA57DRAFT_437341 [Linnemannia elongata]|nr:hypothetical protein BKA57DRAFT_437341 [Linnemannia elongata]
MAHNLQHIRLSRHTAHTPILLLDTVVAYNETPFTQQLPLQGQLTTAQVHLETLVINPTQEQVAEGDHAVDNDVEHDNAVEGQDMQVDHVDGDYVFEVEET